MYSSNRPKFHQIRRNIDPLRIGIVLAPSCNALATQCFVDPFRVVNYLQRAALYDWQFLSVETDGVVASNGLGLGNLVPITDAGRDFDMVVISASYAPDQLQTPALQNWLRRLARAGVNLGGLDTGAFVLAYAGLLDGYRAAVHYEHIASFRELFPKTEMGEALFVLDRDRFTCCGGMAASDMALELIRLENGVDIANAAARYIFHERLRSGDEGQLPEMREPVGYSVPARLRDAIVLMERNLETPVRIIEIAQALNLSQRQLERIFHMHTGISPVKYYVEVRLDRSRSLVTQTEMPIAEIAAACGFGDAAQFTRSYKKRFGIVPSKDRIAGRLPFQFRSFPSPSRSS